MAIEIDCAFPGGNIVVEGIDGDEVRLHQDLRDTLIDWFYWCFRVKGAAGRNLRFVFTRSRDIGVRGPAMSVDGGKTWAWLGSEVVDGNSFQCLIPEGSTEVRLSFAMPYQQSHWRQFMADAGKNPAVRQHRLCLSEKGRDLTLGWGNEAPKRRVAITCRHHCCEMMADYVLEGLLRWILEDEDAGWLCDNVEFFIVPFVDKDGVEDGDQGKGRGPRDHGRDYEGKSMYATTRSIRERIPAWSDGRLCVGLDIHCPHISGRHNEVIYMVGSPSERMDSEQRRFSRMLESSAEGILPFRADDFLPFGNEWNTVSNFSGGKGFARWLAGLPEIKLASSIEVPYANAGGAEVNQASARRFGVDLGKCLLEYLRAD